MATNGTPGWGGEDYVPEMYWAGGRTGHDGPLGPISASGRIDVSGERLGYEMRLPCVHAWSVDPQMKRNCFLQTVIPDHRPPTSEESEEGEETIRFLMEREDQGGALLHFYSQLFLIGSELQLQ